VNLYQLFHLDLDRPPLHFLPIDQACQSFSGLGANDAGVVVRSAPGIGPVQLNHRLLALSNKLLRHGFVHVGVSGEVHHWPPQAVAPQTTAGGARPAQLVRVVLECQK
jgi:hypothetical protein